MSRRTERVGNLLRELIAEALMRRIADPRIDPGRTTITRVEVGEDMLTAKVFVSVMGEPADQRRCVAALSHASGHIQELISPDITMRNMPILSFHADEKFKKTMETLSLIQKAMDEIQDKEAAAGPADDGDE